MSTSIERLKACKVSVESYTTWAKEAIQYGSHELVSFKEDIKKRPELDEACELCRKSSRTCVITPTQRNMPDGNIIRCHVCTDRRKTCSKKKMFLVWAAMRHFSISKDQATQLYEDYGQSLKTMGPKPIEHNYYPSEARLVKVGARSLDPQAPKKRRVLPSSSEEESYEFESSNGEERDSDLPSSTCTSTHDDEAKSLKHITLTRRDVREPMVTQYGLMDERYKMDFLTLKAEIRYVRTTSQHVGNQVSTLSQRVENQVETLSRSVENQVETLSRRVENQVETLAKRIETISQQLERLLFSMDSRGV